MGLLDVYRIKPLPQSGIQLPVSGITVHTYIFDIFYLHINMSIVTTKNCGPVKQITDYFRKVTPPAVQVHCLLQPI